MKNSDIFLTLFILLIFAILFFFNVFSIGIENIKKEWPRYRCNPIIMPFANQFGIDPIKNFTFCVQNIQSSYMTYLLSPVYYIFSIINSSIANIALSIQGIREMMYFIRMFTTSISLDFLGAFGNIGTKLQQMIISIKDLVGKQIGIMAVLMYVMEGSMYTMMSAWKGPAGDVMRALAGGFSFKIPKEIKKAMNKIKKLEKQLKKLCFHPNTLIKLQNGTIKCISEIEIGDILENNTEVISTMELKNYDGKKEDLDLENYKQLNDLYEISNGVNNETILVTDEHLILYNGKWITVKNHPKSKLSSIKTHKLNCLITSNHLIPIGTNTFHDWEDENGKPSKDLI